MPSVAEILRGLTSIANQWQPVAIAWHVILALSILAISVGWRPSARAAAYALISPLLSVMLAALAFANVFNATMFAVLSLGLAAVARRFSSEPVRTPSPPSFAAAAFLVASASVYPHFLETDRWTEYVYAAPLGIVPCPTLLLVTGVSIMCDQFRSRAWMFTLAAAALVYGAMGVFVLGVTLDLVLLGAAFAAIATFDTSIRRRTLAGGAI